MNYFSRVGISWLLGFFSVLGVAAEVRECEVVEGRFYEVKVIGSFTDAEGGAKIV